MVVPVDSANQHQNRAEQKQQLHEPQRPNARQHRNRVQQGLRDGIHRAAHADIEIPRHPVQHEQPQGGRHKQLPRPIAQERAIPLLDKCEPGAHARHDEQQHHEPRVHRAGNGIQKRQVSRIRHTAQDADPVEEVADVVNNDQQNRHPANMVKIRIAAHGDFPPL